MTTPNNQKRNVPHTSNQARPELVNIHEFEDVRGLINVAENDGNVYAYRGSLPSTGTSTGTSTGSKKLYGHIMKVKNKGDAFGCHEMPEGHGGLKAKGETWDSRSDSSSHAFYGQTNSRDCPPPTSEMLAEFFDLPPNLQEMMRYVSAKGRNSPPTPEMLLELVNLTPTMQTMMKFLLAAGSPDRNGYAGGSHR